MDKVLTTINYIKSFLSGNYNITKFNSDIKETICGFDGITDIKFSSNSNISDYTVQYGDFTSYNKVIRPSVIDITLIIEGSFEKIASVLAVLENYKNSTELVDIQTPYSIYIGYNIVNLDYELTVQKGVGLFDCTIKARQVEVNDIQFNSYKNIEERPIILLGKVSTFQGIAEKVNKVSTSINSTLLGVDIIFGSKINLR